MSEFSSIDKFGSLTFNGKTLKFEDFDVDKNGEISIEEYNSVLKQAKLDTVELSIVDKNNDKQISAEEFSIWEQKIKMQEAVNQLANQISIDFSGKSQYLGQLSEELKNLIDDYEKTYYGDISIMAQSFIEELPTLYETIKSNILSNDPSSISASVIYEISNEIANSQYNGQAISSGTISRIVSELNTEATKFIQGYTGNDFEYDLRIHLTEFLNTSEAEVMSEAVSNYKNNISSFDENTDLKQAKEAVGKLLLSFLENGIKINLANLNILTEAAISTALDRFSNVTELLNAIDEIINSLNTKSRKDVFIQEEAEKELEEQENNFLSIKGFNYTVDAQLIDYTKVDSRYFEENGRIYHRGKGWDGLKDKAYDEGLEILTSEALKKQIKAQIEAMLKEKGFSFDKIAIVFENVYNQSAIDTLNTEGMITGRSARGLSSKGKAYINVKNLCDTFVTTFNTNIVKAIDEMNASKTDMDTIDLDYSALNTSYGEDFATLYASGRTITTLKKGADYYVETANQLVDNIKSQILAKAQALCEANGVEFDNTSFETIFNDAKSVAVNTAVTGCDKKGRNWVGTGASVAIGAMAGISALATATNPADLILAGALHSGGVLGGIFGFGGDKSKSTLNTKTLLDTFTEQFKTNFTAWVGEKKTEEENL